MDVGSGGGMGAIVDGICGCCCESGNRELCSSGSGGGVGDIGGVDNGGRLLLAPSRPPSGRIAELDRRTSSVSSASAYV